jgi:hypothetical protein
MEMLRYWAGVRPFMETPTSSFTTVLGWLGGAPRNRNFDDRCRGCKGERLRCCSGLCLELRLCL